MNEYFCEFVLVPAYDTADERLCAEHYDFCACQPLHTAGCEAIERDA